MAKTKRKSNRELRRELRQAQVGPTVAAPKLTNAQSYWAFVCADGGKKPRPRRK